MLTSWTQLTRLKIGLLAAAATTTALLVGAGTASADATGCTFGSSSGNVETCFSIIGNGPFVSRMTATACVEDSARTIQVCIHGPDSALPRCTPFELVQPGNCITEVWSPDRDVTPGEYCARTWRDNADGSHTLIGEVCKEVS